MQTLPYGTHRKGISVPQHSGGAPSGLVEYGYYFSVLNTIMGPALGLSVEFLGVGIMGVLAVLCVLSLRPRGMAIYAPIVFPIGCALSFFVLQVLLHEEALLGERIRPFFIWILALIIVQSLSFRQGFLHRFGLAAFLIGLTLLPYLKMDYVSTSQFQRAGLGEGVGLANPNDLAAWFGFCALYFIIVGIETPRAIMRIASWLMTVGCLYVVGLTVSRGTLLAFAIASIIALRRLLKRGFLPLLFLCTLSWILYESGVFEQAAASYTTRGAEQTGRFSVWPLAVKRFLQAPLTGVGVSHLETYIPETGRFITPHNGFLYVGLTSGIVPLVFFVLYWWRAARGAFRRQSAPIAEAPFFLPLLTYAFLITLEGNLPFMKPWAIVALSLAIAGDVSRRVNGVVVRRYRRGSRVRHVGRRDSDALVAYQLRHLPPRP